MDKKKRIAAVTLSLGFMLLSFNHCVIKQKTASKGNSATSESTSTSSAPTESENNLPDPIVDITPPPTPVTPTPSEPAPPPEVIQAQQIDVGVKNFEQINATMSVLTGVNSTSNAVRNTYEDIEVQLPTDNAVKSFLAANQVAITKLAAEYCDQLVNNSTLRSRVWPGFDFSRGPASVLSNNSQKFGVVNQTLDTFWGMNVGGSRNTSQAEMLSLIDALLAGEDPNNRNTTATAMKGICTAALASAQVTLM